LVKNMAHSQHNISADELSKLLEPLIRKVVREELNRIVVKNPKTFNLKPETPLHDDMQDILKRKSLKKIKLHSHDEVWD